jgi:hypothetical protein
LGIVPHKPCQQEAMTHLNPKSCLLPLSTPSRGMTRHGRTQVLSFSNGSPQHWPLPRSQPHPPHRAVEVSSSLVLSNAQGPPHQAGQRQARSSSRQGRSGHRGWWAAVGPRALLKSGELSVHAALGLVTRWVWLAVIQIPGHLSVLMLRMRGGQETVSHQEKDKEAKENLRT